jgi:DnaJ-class molecular chaperone
MEPLVETVHDPFKKLIEYYFDTSYFLLKMLLAGPTLLNEPDRMPTRLKIPIHLQAEYSLLQLQAGASLAEVRTQYRELAKLYHPDVGGHHTSFIALQQAYERVAEYLQTPG